jgi:hypothetical protein
MSIIDCQLFIGMSTLVPTGTKLKAVKLKLKRPAGAAKLTPKRPALATLTALALPCPVALPCPDPRPALWATAGGLLRLGWLALATKAPR